MQGGPQRDSSAPPACLCSVQPWMTAQIVLVAFRHSKNILEVRNCPIGYPLQDDWFSELWPELRCHEVATPPTLLRKVKVCEKRSRSAPATLWRKHQCLCKAIKNSTNKSTNFKKSDHHQGMVATVIMNSPVVLFRLICLILESIWHFKRKSTSIESVLNESFQPAVVQNKKKLSCTVSSSCQLSLQVVSCLVQQNVR